MTEKEKEELVEKVLDHMVERAIEFATQLPDIDLKVLAKALELEIKRREERATKPEPELDKVLVIGIGLVQKEEEEGEKPSGLN